DPVVVGVEGRSLQGVRQPPDVPRPAQCQGPPQALDAGGVGVLAPLGEEVELPGPPAAVGHHLDRQAEGGGQRPHAPPRPGGSPPPPPQPPPPAPPTPPAATAAPARPAAGPAHTGRPAPSSPPRSSRPPSSRR